MASRGHRNDVWSLTLSIFVALVVCFLNAAPVRAADTLAGSFLTPPDAGPNAYFLNNSVYQLGTTIQLGWATSLSEYQLRLSQQSLNQSTARRSQVVLLYKNEGAVEPGGMSWYVQTYEFDLEASHVFFLEVAVPQGFVNGGFTSHYFNITRGPIPTTTATTTTTTAASPPATVLPASPSSSSENNPTSSSEPPATSSGAQTTGSPPLKVTMGIGIGIGVPLAALCAFVAGFLLFRKKRHRSAGDAPTVRHDSFSSEHAVIWTPDGSSSGSQTALCRPVPAELWATPLVTDPRSTPRVPELRGTPKPPELDGSSLPIEMDCVF